MGMFDIFTPKKAVICPVCKTQEIDEFQTKEFENLLANFKEGKKAVYYGKRMETKEEKKKRLKILRKKYPEIDKELLNMFGCVRQTRKIIGRIPDGKYKVYGFCDNCKKLVYVIATIKKGIFKGIKCD